MHAFLPCAFEEPSPWLTCWAPRLLPAGCEVLDVACGAGRHMRWLAEHGWQPLGVDCNAPALAAAAEWGRVLHVDLERDPWPLAGRHFAGVLVSRYLWRPLLPHLMAAVAPGGVLLYESFAVGEVSGNSRPMRPEFLLQPGELLRLFMCEGWRIVASEDGFAPSLHLPVQRIAALRLLPDGSAPHYSLE